MTAAHRRSQPHAPAWLAHLARPRTDQPPAAERPRPIPHLRLWLENAHQASVEARRPKGKHWSAA